MPNLTLATLSTGRRRRRLFAAALGFALAGVSAAFASDAAVSKEYQLKAAFLFNFTKFVEWPATRFTDATSPIVIGVLGEDPFGPELKNLVKDRKVNGRDIVVKPVATLAEAGAVHLLFVSPRDEKQLAPALAQLRAASVLTVGESPAFAGGGGIITFSVVEDKVRFEINQTAGEAAGLKLSAQLLKLATVVRHSP
jgi:hypothetical protein